MLLGMPTPAFYPTPFQDVKEPSKSWPLPPFFTSHPSTTCSTRNVKIPQVDDNESAFGTDLERNATKKFTFDKLAKELRDLGVDNPEDTAQLLGDAGLVRAFPWIIRVPPCLNLDAHRAHAVCCVPCITENVDRPRSC